MDRTQDCGSCNRGSTPLEGAEFVLSKQKGAYREERQRKRSKEKPRS